MKKKYKTNQKKRRTTAPNNLTNRRSARATEDRRTDVTPPRYFYCQRNLYTSTFIPFLVSSFSFFFFSFSFPFFRFSRSPQSRRVVRTHSCPLTLLHAHIKRTHIYTHPIKLFSLALYILPPSLFHSLLPPFPSTIILSTHIDNN